MYQFVSEVNGVNKRKFQKTFYKLGDETYIQKIQ